MKRRDFVSAAAAAIAARTAMSQVPNSPLLCLGSSCQTGQLTNGSSFTVAGSGFGTKSASAPTIYDNCQGTNILNLWTWVWHGTQEEGTTDAWQEQYHLPTDVAPDSSLWGQGGANFVGPATPFRQKYICSALQSVIGGYASAGLQFAKTFSTLAPPFYLVCSWYECISPNWVFGVGHTPHDYNFKWIVYTTELTGGYGTNYWYMEDQNGAFTSANAAPAFDINDDGAGIVGRMKNTPSAEWISPNMPNKLYNSANGWVKKELSMYMTSGTNGYVSMTVSQPKVQPRWNGYLWNNTVGSGTTDPYSGTGRTFWLGGFRRDFPNAVNRQYWSDIYLDVQTSGVQRFALTDTNSLSTATVVEYQPYTAWSNTSVTLTCSKGNLASGTVYLWLLDEVNGSRLIGPYSMS
jgi:hypothetical protein